MNFNSRVNWKDNSAVNAIRLAIMLIAFYVMQTLFSPGFHSPVDSFVLVPTLAAGVAVVFGVTLGWFYGGLLAFFAVAGSSNILAVSADMTQSILPEALMAAVVAIASGFLLTPVTDKDVWPAFDWALIRSLLAGVLIAVASIATIRLGAPPWGGALVAVITLWIVASWTGLKFDWETDWLVVVGAALAAIVSVIFWGPVAYISVFLMVALGSLWGRTLQRAILK